MMAGKHLAQALPLVHRELPLPEMLTPDGQSMLQQHAKVFTIHSQVSGKVTKVNDKEIVVDGVKHELFDKYPFQAKVALTHEPVVRVGDTVKKGDLLADSNYSRDGKLALGVNVRTAYMPWKNASNFEDAIVISDSASKKFTSDHMHRLHLELSKTIAVGKQLTLAQFPTKFPDKELIEKIGEDGLVKVGAEVKPGDPLVMAVEKVTFSKDDISYTNLSKIHRLLERPYKDVSIFWNEIFPGKVSRVIKTAGKVEIQVDTEEPMQVGDKLSMSSAAKGTVSEIIPDDKMPRTDDGRHIEVILNPLGVAGRINPSQTVEQAAGKLVREGKQKYSFTNFDNVNHADKIDKALKKLGISHTERLYDPETGKYLEKPVAVGWNYMFKLDHPVRKKFSARGRESYTVDETPTAGKGVGGQSYDQLTTYALLGHNAHAILGESVGIRGTKNDDFWHAYQAGTQPPPPKVPFIFNKLEAYLNAAGVDTKTHNNTMSFMPFTDKRILERSNGEITKGTILKTRAGSRSFTEEKGGLFDNDITGGLKGEHWSHIKLSEKMPHPLYEKVIRDITRLKTSEYYGLLGRTKHWDKKLRKFVDVPSENTVTGSEAFEDILSFDPEEKLKELKHRLLTATGSDKNRDNRATRYVRGLINLKLSPKEAYMTSVVPVLPPKYRSVIEMKDGSLKAADSNRLYRDVLLTNEELSKAKEEGIPDEQLAKTRVATYEAVGALVGVNNALTHRDDREDARGFIDIIKGKTNKTGFFQSMLIRRRNDYTGRSTVEPDATLGVDEIGLPEDMAWKIYEPTLIRKMAQRGWKPADALKEVMKRSQAAKDVLLNEMSERPVLYNRAPSLHRWNIAAAMPTITPGKEVRISPIATGPQNIDFDGDTCAIHVPITDAAKRESFSLLPSKNLIYDKDRSLAYTPEKDIVVGLFALTRTGSPSGLTFENEQAALDAFKNNTNNSMKMNSTVTIKGRGQQSLGWIMFQDLLPTRYRSMITQPVDGKKLKALATRIARESPGDYSNILRKLTQAGFQAASAAGGITSTIGELAIDRSRINRLLAIMDNAVQKGKTLEEKRQIAEEMHKKYLPEIHKEISEHLAKEDAGYNMFLLSKPSGKVNIDQFTQMIASPILVKDIHGVTAPSIIRSAYGSGMSSSDYILTTPGARAGMVAKSLSTALPGFLAKEIAGNLGPVRIYEKDCGTVRGIESPLEQTPTHNDVDLLDRHLAAPVMGFIRNDVVTPDMLAKLRDAKIDQILVRSPMTCEAKSPPCQMCAGRAPNGELHEIGSNIGLNYGQAVSEPSTQLTLRLFHSGGTVGSGDNLLAGFARLNELLSAPETVKNEGALATVAGRIDSVRMAPQGGYFIKIVPLTGDPVEQYVNPGRTLKVRGGQRVNAGDPLSDGSYKPQVIAATKGLLAAQQYVVDEARKSYQSAGVTVRRPVLEVLASQMRHIEITNDGGEHDLATGDVLPETVYEARRKKNSKIQGVPTILGLSQKPLISTDLFERLGFQRLESAVAEIPAVGGESDLTGGTSPVPGMAYGAKFR
jgi:DNA-directed RNA polymerase subunit beta'